MSPITVECRRISRNAERMMRQSSYVAEVPIRLHAQSGSRDQSPRSISIHPTTEVRAIHDGLGGPPFAADFERYLVAAGVCFCEGTDIEGNPYHTCDRDERGARFRASRHRGHPTRLKRAFRQLRRMSPAAFDIIFPVAARGQSVEQVRDRINAGRESRGQEPYSQTEFGVHWYAGWDLLVALW